MKVKSKIIAILLCAVLAFCVIAVFTACEETVEPPAPEYKVYSVTLQYNGKNIDGNVLNADVSAGTLQLTTKVVKDDGAEATVTYASSVSEVATVSKDGLVTLAGKGETVISATAGDKKHEIVLVVADDYSVADSYTITVNGGTASVTSAPEGTYVTLTANVPEHQDFIEWEFDVEGLWINGNVFKMPAKNVNVTAKFEAMKYTLNVVGATVAKADENTDPIGSDGGNTEGGELPEYDMNVYRFEYGTEISVEAIAEPEGKIFVGWDYGVENNRVGEMGIPEYGPFEMPDSTLTVWAVFSPITTTVWTAATGPYNGSAIKEGGGDSALEGLSGYSFSFAANTGASSDYPENITGSAFNTTQSGTQTMKAIFRNKHESLPITVEIYITYYDNMVTSGLVTVGPGEVLTHYFSAGIGIYNPWWGIAVRKDIGGNSDDSVPLDVVLGCAPTYPNGDKLLSVSGAAEYVNLEKNGENSVNPKDYGSGWPRDKILNNDVGLMSVAVYDGNFGADGGSIPGYITAKITNMPTYDSNNPTTSVYVRFIYNVNNELEPFGTLDFAITNNTKPINSLGEIEAMDAHHLEVTEFGYTEVFKLEVPRTAEDNGEFYFNIIKMKMDKGDSLAGLNFSVQMTYNNVMGYVEA